MTVQGQMERCSGGSLQEAGLEDISRSWKENQNVVVIKRPVSGRMNRV
jgi:hypothetical protein